MNFAVIGAGGIAQAHLAAATAHPLATVLWVCDVRLEAAEAAARACAGARASVDGGEAIADVAVDAVVIAIPTHLHAQWHVRAARAGKHILTEKPICRTVAEAQSILDTCEERGARLAVGYQRRFSPARIKAREIIWSGVLGRPVTWTVSSFGPRSDFYRGPNNWMWDVSMGGGMAMDGSIHDFDFAVWALGMPVSMFAQSSCISDAVSAPTQASAVIQFEHGDRMVYGASWQEGDMGSGAAPYSVVGPQGTIVMEGEYGLTWRHGSGEQQRFAWDPNELEPQGLGGVWLFYRQLDAFIRTIEGEPRDTSLAAGDEALGSLWIAENIVAAEPEGRLFTAPARAWRPLPVGRHGDPPDP